MVLIMPRQYVEELRSVPEDRLSLRHLQVHVSSDPSTSLPDAHFLISAMSPEPLRQKHNYRYPS